MLNMENPSDAARINQNMSGRAVRVLLEGNGVGNRPDLQEVILKRFEFDYRASSLPPSYPYARYLQLVEFLRLALYPDTPVDQAFQLLGYRATQTYFQGVGGQVLRIAAQVMGPQQGAKQFVKKMRSSLPWGSHDLVAARANYVAYRKGGIEGPPGLMLGVLQASLEACGIKPDRLSYKVESPIEDSVLYEISWL